MATSEKSTLRLEGSQQPVPLWKKIVNLDNICLVVATVFLLGVFIISAISASPNAENFGFANSTGDVSNEFYLQTTPAGFTFSIWGVIFTWQALWMLYAWSYVFRPSTPRAISWITLLLYTCANTNTIIWLFVWGNNRTDVSLAFVFFAWAFLWAGIWVQSVHLHRLAPDMSSTLKRYKIDLWITRLLVTNGLVIYGTWLTVATLLNFGIILRYFADVSDVTTGAVVVWMLSVVALSYFALENTVLDRYARFIFMVYPVLIWALSGAMSAHWGREEPDTNPVLTLLLLLLSIGLLLARIALVTIFAFFRPLYPEQSKKSSVLF